MRMTIRSEVPQRRDGRVSVILVCEREGERSTRCSSAYVAAKVADLANTAWSTLVKVIRAVIVQH